MRVLSFWIAGALVQVVALTSFILVSRTTWAWTGKPVVISLAILAIGLLLWREVRVSGIGTLFLLPVMLSFGWMLAVYALGVTAFPGLLSDSHLDIDFLLDSLRIFVDLTVMYGIATMVLFGLHRWLGCGRRPIAKSS
jgi:hypothetical protein